MGNDIAYATLDFFAGPEGLDIRPGLLLIADRMDDDMVAPLVAASGLRLLGRSPIAGASDRLDEQTRCDCLLLFCPDPDPLLERLLVQIETQAIQTGMSAIIVTSYRTVDLAYACLRDPGSQLLCDPDAVELAAALMTAMHHRPDGVSVHEVDREAVHLQQLTDEVGRLARTLDALTHRRSAAPSFDLGSRISDSPADYIGMPVVTTNIALSHASVQGLAASSTASVSSVQVRDLLRARRMRSDFLPGDLFADPAWDMLLDLLAAQLEQERVSVSSLCIAAAVPPTTALRWIRTLTDQGLVERHADPQDGRRVFVTLAPDTADAMLRWFGATRRLLGGRA